MSAFIIAAKVTYWLTVLVLGISFNNHLGLGAWSWERFVIWIAFYTAAEHFYNEIREEVGNGRSNTRSMGR